MPKLLLVGVVEKTCLKTVVREIPNIKDCFLVVNDDNKKGSSRPTRQVCPLQGPCGPRNADLILVDDQWLQFHGHVASC